MQESIQIRIILSGDFENKKNIKKRSPHFFHINLLFSTFFLPGMAERRAIFHTLRFLYMLK